MYLTFASFIHSWLVLLWATTTEQLWVKRIFYPVKTLLLLSQTIQQSESIHNLFFQRTTSNSDPVSVANVTREQPLWYIPPSAPYVMHDFRSLGTCRVTARSANRFVLSLIKIKYSGILRR